MGRAAILACCVVACGDPHATPRDGAVIGTDVAADTPSPDAGSSAMGLPQAFFSMTIGAQGTLPPFPIGGLRLWDTSAVWPNQPKNGTYDFTQLDAWLAEATAANLDVMFTFGRTPEWASGSNAPCGYGSGCALPPSDVATTDQILKDFTTALVEHSLAGSGAHIKYYEIWNEPDVPGTWQGTPAQLATMGKDIYATVHALDPDAIVIGPSPSTGNQYGIHFLPDYYAAGGAPNCDIVGMHAYLYGSDGQFADVPEAITTTIDQLRTLMTTYSIADKPIIFTEGTWGGPPTNAEMTQDDKVAYLGREHMLMWMNGISRYYWYAYDNPSWGTLSDLATGVAYGIIDDWLVGSTHGDAPCAQQADATWTCSLVRRDGTPAVIAWNATATHSLTAPAGMTSYLTLDNSATNPIADGAVEVGAKPIMLVP
jgi:Cellulase (glycosyl hydrolase family 5)